jgi:DNA-binding MarR family transcriptional regulator
MPSKAKAKKDVFVQVPLWWAEQAAQATRTSQAMVWLWLLHLSWKEHSPTFKLPNERLAVRGVKRSAKTRALRNLEEAGLIQVERERGKSPTVTLLYL